MFIGWYIQCVYKCILPVILKEFIILAHTQFGGAQSQEVKFGNMLYKFNIGIRSLFLYFFWQGVKGASQMYVILFEPLCPLPVDGFGLFLSVGLDVSSAYFSFLITNIYLDRQW